MKKTAKTNSSINTVVFDLGGVLIDWNPRHLYRKIFGDDENGMETFLAEVCHSEWNLQQDRGRPWQDAIAEAITRFPDQEANIRAYRERWDEMLKGPIEGTVNILEELKSTGLRLLALTNWSPKPFPGQKNVLRFSNGSMGFWYPVRKNWLSQIPLFFIY